MIYDVTFSQVAVTSQLVIWKGHCTVLCSHFVDDHFLTGPDDNVQGFAALIKRKFELGSINRGSGLL